MFGTMFRGSSLLHVSMDRAIFLFSHLTRPPLKGQNSVIPLTNSAETHIIRKSVERSTTLAEKNVTLGGGVGKKKKTRPHPQDFFLICTQGIDQHKKLYIPPTFQLHSSFGSFRSVHWGRVRNRHVPQNTSLIFWPTLNFTGQQYFGASYMLIRALNETQPYDNFSYRT